jgi:hypothetical protein
MGAYHEAKRRKGGRGGDSGGDCEEESCETRTGWLAMIGIAALFACGVACWVRRNKQCAVAPTSQAAQC